MNSLFRLYVTAFMLFVGAAMASATVMQAPVVDPSILVERESLKATRPEPESVVIDYGTFKQLMMADMMADIKKHELSPLDEQAMRNLLHEFAPILAEAIKRGVRATHEREPESMIAKIKKAVKNAAISCVWPVTKKKVLILSLIYSLTYATFLFIEPQTARYYTGQAFATIFPLVGNVLITSGKFAAMWAIEATKFGVRFVLPEAVSESLGQSFMAALAFCEKVYSWYPGVAPVVG